jgi:orotidine-5'-phosphate decarboxylase
VAAAVAAGCGGVVCAVPDLPTVKAHTPGIFAATPGIRLPGGDLHDQRRVSTPGAAVAAGADLLVVGRAVTAAAYTGRGPRRRASPHR